MSELDRANWEGYREGRAAGRKAGWDAGYFAGVEDGFKRGWNEALKYVQSTNGEGVNHYL
jgi:flagellar biosynthesis/type III secretory pathway protein FliH